MKGYRNSILVTTDTEEIKQKISKINIELIVENCFGVEVEAEDVYVEYIDDKVWNNFAGIM